MIQPFHNYVILEEVKKENASGIILPEEQERESYVAKVVIKAEGVKLDIKEGDTVLYQGFGFNDIEIDGKKYLIGKEENIYGKL